MLTQQQILEARKQLGLSKAQPKTEWSEIDALLAETPKEETGVSGLMGANVGVLKGGVSTLTGMSSLGQRGIQAVGRLLTPKSLEKSFGFEKQEQTSAEKLIPERLRTPYGTAEKIGFGAEQLGEFFIPGSMSLKAGKVASTAVKGGKLLKSTAGLAATGLTEGLLGTGQSAIQSGKLGGKELLTGAISTVAPASLAVAGKAIKLATPKPVKTIVIDAINKALRPSMASIKNPKYYDKAVEAFNVLKDNKKIFGDEEIARNPKNLIEMGESLKNSKKVIYDIYDTLSKKAGEVGAVYNPNKIQKDLSDWISGSGYSQEIKDYASKRLDSLSDLNGATPKQIQDRIEELNGSINFFPSTNAQKIQNQIDASIANRLKENLDELITKTTGNEYQKYRNQYSALKTIEKDLERNIGIQARKSQVGLSDLTDIFTGGQLLSGVLTANPQAILQGGTGVAIKKLYKYLSDPNRYIDNAFRALEGKSPNLLTKLKKS